MKRPSGTILTVERTCSHRNLLRHRNVLASRGSKVVSYTLWNNKHRFLCVEAHFARQKKQKQHDQQILVRLPYACLACVTKTSTSCLSARTEFTSNEQHFEEVFRDRALSNSQKLSNSTTNWTLQQSRLLVLPCCFSCRVSVSEILHARSNFDERSVRRA